MCYIHAFVTTLGISLMLQDKIPIGAVLKSKFLCFCQHGSFQDYSRRNRKKKFLLVLFSQFCKVMQETLRKLMFKTNHVS